MGKRDKDAASVACVSARERARTQYRAAQRLPQRPSLTQSVNSAHVAEAWKPASAIEWRRKSIHLGSNARRLAIAHARQARTTSAASAAIAIAPVEMLLPALLGRVMGTADTGAAGAAVGGATVVVVPQQLGTVAVPDGT
jgi:hypothetical protein